jgi:hypothetical protein
MKNVQVIDGAANCTFSIFQFDEQQFELLFSLPGQNIAFIDEVCDRLTESEAVIAFAGVWDRPIQKSEVVGLHGTLFYDFEERKSWFPASRRECDWDEGALNKAQRRLNSTVREASSK